MNAHPPSSDSSNSSDSSPTSSDPHSSPLANLGFSPHFEAAFEQRASPEAVALRVARVDAEGCTLLGAGEVLRGRVPKRLRSKSPPVVGDWVAARERRGELIVRTILPRATSLTRRAAGHQGRAQVLAANLDLVVICMGLDRDFRLPRLERWLSLVHEGGARPLVLLTKAGLVSEDERRERVSAALRAAREVDVIAVDVFAGLGLDALERALSPAQAWAPSLAFVGSSGVGKSTLVNHLCGHATAQTAAVSESHGKGRHTTSHRELFEVTGRRLLLIDTPGLREVGLWGEGQGLDATFAELVALARGCRFSDCEHADEPDCAIRTAIEAGSIDVRRVESWRALQAEQRATARRASEHERRAHEKRFAKLYRTTQQHKRKRKGS